MKDNKWLCMMHPTHLTSTQAMFVCSGRLELYKLVVRYCSVLEVQEEITLCFVALKPPLYFEWTLCDSLGWFPSPFSLLVSWLPTGSRQEATWHSRPLILAGCGALCPLKGRELPCGAKNFTFPMTWCALRNLLVSAVNTAIAKESLSRNVINVFSAWGSV